MLGAGLAEMDLRVDDAGQDVEAGAVDDLAGARLVERAERGDAAVADADIADTDPVVVDDGAVPEEDVEVCAHSRHRRSHARSDLAQPAAPAYVSRAKLASREAS